VVSSAVVEAPPSRGSRMEVLRLADEIHLRDDVEWAEAGMSAPVHKDMMKSYVPILDVFCNIKPYN